MIVVHSIGDLDIPAGRKVGFVPTMGAFHDGHLQLMRRSTEICDLSVASLFVNPTQFGKGEDFTNYPRNLTEDAKMAEGAGVDILFAPSQGEMYPDPAMTVVSVPEVGKRWEGEHRPGHFEGVATVVAKLFNIVEPDIAFFGRKDFQQCAVIKRLVRDLNFRLEISIEPTVRESDGLAMSSRNRYLSESDRKVAPTIFHTLKQCRTKMLKGLEVAEALESGKSELADAGFSVDYIAYVDDASLEPLKQLRQDSTLICAARLKATRLIDNISVI